MRQPCGVQRIKQTASWRSGGRELAQTSSAEDWRAMTCLTATPDLDQRLLKQRVALMGNMDTKLPRREHQSSSAQVFVVARHFTLSPYKKCSQDIHIRLAHPLHVLVVLVAVQQLKAAFPISHLSSSGQSSASAPRLRFLAAFRPFLRGCHSYKSPDEIGLKRRHRAKSSCGLSDRTRLPRYAVRLFSFPSFSVYHSAISGQFRKHFSSTPEIFTPQVAQSAYHVTCTTPPIT